MDELLLLLARRGALARPVRLRTAEIGEEMGMSQQNASVRLRSLETEGLIERKGRMLALTKDGILSLLKSYSQLKSVFENPGFKFAGQVVDGLGEGRYYMTKRPYVKEFEKKLGFKPFGGTLNLEISDSLLEQRLQLRETPPVKISGFRMGGRTFGPIDAYKCKVGAENGAIIFPIRNHHPLNVLEVVAPSNLRKALSLSTGAKLEVEAIF